MISYREFITEISSQSVDIEWNKNEKELFGKFTIKDCVFDIEVTMLDNDSVDIYQFKFYRENQTRMFNDGKYVFGVIPTIKHALDYTMSELNPDILVFASSDDSKARKAMYKLEASNIASKYKYLDMTKSSELQEYGFSSDIIFGVYKSKVVLDKALKEIN